MACTVISKLNIMLMVIMSAIADVDRTDVDNFSCQSFHLSGKRPTFLLPPAVLNGFW